MTQAEDPRVGLAQNRTGMVTFPTQLALDRNYPCLDAEPRLPWRRLVLVPLGVSELRATARSIEMALGRHRVRRSSHRNRSRYHN